ncbi:hypothetical protein PMZ80_006913 [Knufia obscura]|uniref:Rhodanese domain-containing protein n=2 Tax=Knufia TaxID=430999 RepID=A0AAN8EKI4_9EURO|nr:hypothetical protein PMZ80_006913 [Knufia obscura]KAK5957453.1 hypothetical protein OHC33_001828 [Knufia fluminis]
MSSANQPESPPWHAAFPAPKATPGAVTASQLLQMIQQFKASGQPTYMLVDVRRNDHEGGTVSTSVNLPAQSMYYSLSTLVALVKATGSVKSVIFYCGSSRGRGPRSAGWFQDALDQHGIEDIKSYILEGGIKGWVKQGRQSGHQEMLTLTEGYEPGYWDQHMDN